MATDNKAPVSTTPMLDKFKCDKVQIPPPGLFNSNHLIWYSNEAVIPSHRVADFVKGEGANPLYNTRYTIRKIDNCFDVTGRRYVRYACAYGPRDFRDKALKNLPTELPPTTGKGSRLLAQTQRLGESELRGCVSHFVAIYLKLKPEVCIIKWAAREHVDEKGGICHGKLDPTAAEFNCDIAKYLSPECLEFVKNYLRAGVAPRQVIQEHQKEVYARCKEANAENCNWSRDLQLQLKDVLNARDSLRRQQGAMFSKHDHIATYLWIEKHRNHVLFYQPASEDETKPFILVWGAPWMIQKLAKFGHGRAISMDATFATNVYDYYLFTVLCYDDFQNGVPCCWALLEKRTSNCITIFLNALKEKVEQVRQQEMGIFQAFKPTCLIVDDAAEEHAAIKVVFPDSPIILCLYHVRQAWLKQIYLKVKCRVARNEINKDLANLMHGWREDAEAKEASDQFMAKWEEQEHDFVSYYRKEWHGSLHWWIKQYRKFNHNNQETTGAVERWHRTLKSFLFTDKKDKKGRTISWLLWILHDKVEISYWVSAGLKHQGRIRNSIIERQVLRCIYKAKKIPDRCVRFFEDGGRHCASVESASKPGTFYELISFDKEYATCSCGHAAQGNMCKHQIKCLTLWGYSEVHLLRVLGAKFGTPSGGMEKLDDELCGGPTIVVEGEEGITLQLVGASEDTAAPAQDPTSAAECAIHEPTTEIVGLPSMLPLKVHSRDEFMAKLSDVLDKIEGIPLLMQETWGILNEGYQVTLDLKAKFDTMGAFSLADFQQQPFVPRPGAEGFSIARKKSWVERMHGKRRPPAQSTKNADESTLVSKVPTAIRPFRKSGTRKPKLSLQQKVQTEARLPLASLESNINQNPKPKERKGKKRAVPTTGSDYPTTNIAMPGFNPPVGESASHLTLSTAATWCSNWQGFSGEHAAPSTGPYGISPTYSEMRADCYSSNWCALSQGSNSMGGVPQNDAWTALSQTCLPSGDEIENILRDL